MQITIPLTAALSLIPAALGAAVNRRQTDASSRQVFAHYMVGLTSGQTATQWQTDIAEAQASGIDGFALNVGAADTWNAEQLQYAYDAASAQDGFSLFLSFDQAASTWTVDGIVALVNQYRDAAAQFKVADGRPLVSTFEGPAWADNWATVRAQTGDIYLVPDWSSLGASGVAGHLDQIDGACEFSLLLTYLSPGLTSIYD
ncbi:glycosyl hydrolase family 71-domain-containing protein [Xylariomycetidae sp. FL2044]|nr:glycosyl hydrolase family 71-domain-containing protein [Xylariomycetidae sp. FL2044]